VNAKLIILGYSFSRVFRLNIFNSSKVNSSIVNFVAKVWLFNVVFLNLFPHFR
jgi:hypothetical protein